MESLLLIMDFTSSIESTTLYQHIDALFEQERCAETQILIDEQFNHPIP
ncbi:MAG: hypothetical protein ACFFFH_14010 [Candidatus Thorarchaeota archaeon]